MTGKARSGYSGRASSTNGDARQAGKGRHVPDVGAAGSAREGSGEDTAAGPAAATEAFDPAPSSDDGSDVSVVNGKGGGNSDSVVSDKEHQGSGGGLGTSLVLEGEMHVHG